MALPTLQRKLFKNDGYGPEIKDERLSADITVKDWDASHDYPANVLAKAGGDIYRSVAASGPGSAAGGVNPLSDDGSYWVIFSVDDAAVVHKTGAETITGAKKFTQAITGATYINDGSYSSVSSSNTALQGSLNAGSELLLIGGVADGVFAHEGAKIVLRNPDRGSILLQAHDANEYSALSLHPSGSMDWHGFYGYVSQQFTMGSAYPSSYIASVFRLADSNTDNVAHFGAQVSTSGQSICFLRVNRYMSKNTGLDVQLLCGPNASDDTYFRPNPDNSISLGSYGRRWTQLYAATASINTSDERVKDSVSGIPDDVLDAWGDVGFVQFQFKESLIKKGSDARFHSGLIAQRIDAAFAARGLDASRYGLFCHDEWEAEPEGLDENGKVVSPAMDAGDMYSLRYEEALCMEAAYQRRRADRAEARLASLEARLAVLEAKLNG